MGKKPENKTFFFTLLELLIVITIMVILISMLLPALHHAKELSHSIVCINNLKQNRVAAESYLSDFNGYLNSYIATPGMDYTWASNFYKYKYISSVNNVLCPSSPPYKYETSVTSGVNGVAKYYIYGMLAYAGAYTSDFYDYSLHCLNANKVRYPSSYPLFADTANSTGEQWCSFSFYSSYTKLVRLSHGKNANVVFLDGHAESCTESKIRDFAVKTNSEVANGPTMAIWIYDKNYIAQQIGP